MELRKEETKKQIKKAFASVRKSYRKRGRVLPSIDYWRHSLDILNPDDYKYYLAYMMEYLLDVHGVEHILEILNVNHYMSEPHKQDIVKNSSKSTLKAIEKANKQHSLIIKQRVFETFDKQQVEAINMWLLHIRAFKNIQYIADELEGALVYWNKRSCELEDSGSKE